MLDPYEQQESSSYDIELMDEIPPSSASSLLSFNDELTESNRLSTTTPQNAITLRFKVC